MRMFRLLAVVGVLAISTLLGAPRHVQAQLDETAAWASHLSNTYRVLPNVTYHIANNRENKIDLYLPRDADGPTPVLMYIHGGGWRAPLQAFLPASSPCRCGEPATCVGTSHSRCRTRR